MAYNRTAPTHRSINCLDIGNNYSHVPIQKRIYNQGQHINQSSVCKICHCNESTMGFSPCGHLVTCETCGSKAAVCPVCNQSITNRQKLLFS